MQITNEVANILADSMVENNNLYLPDIQLERKLYVAVNKVLEAIGGKWNRKAKSHIFDESPVDIIEQILQTGEYIDEKKEFQFFETPEHIAKQLIKLADIQPDETVLEPSAGKGAIAKYIPNCDCIELNELNRKHLIENGFNIVGEEFLKFETKYDVIIANPPFSFQSDISHVLHMIELANRKVVSVMSASVLFRTNKKTKMFRESVNKLGGSIEPLPDNSFKNSGTNIRTCIASVNII